MYKLNLVFGKEKLCQFAALISILPFIIFQDSLNAQSYAFDKSQAHNIILVIADDLGPDVLRMYPELGMKKARTPFLDTLAANGLVFTRAWAYPICGPTRASILSGKSAYRTNVLQNVMITDSCCGLSNDEMGIQRFVKKYSKPSYETAVIGKWHVADALNGGNDHPNLFGVDHYSGVVCGDVAMLGETYYDWMEVTNGTSHRVTDYMTSVFVNESIEWIHGQKDPWFLWLAFTAPHGPYHCPPDSLLGRLRPLNKDPESIRNNPFPHYVASIEAMDRELSRLYRSLSPEQRLNTSWIFIGDNGTDPKVCQEPYCNSPLDGKMSLYESGLHIPMIISGAGVQRRGYDSSLVQSTDLFATIASLTGVELTKYEDSYSLSGILSGEDSLFPREFAMSELRFTLSRSLQHQHLNGVAVRNHRYKLIYRDNGKEEFYDLQKDPWEDVNLFGRTSWKSEIDQFKKQAILYFGRNNLFGRKQ